MAYGDYSSEWTPEDTTTNPRRYKPLATGDQGPAPAPDGTTTDTTEPIQPQPFNTPPATTPPTATKPAAGGIWGTANDAGGWIDQKLASVQSTDDPGYWKIQMGKDSKAMAGDPSALAWWEDAIRRGDGSALVTSGQLQKRSAGSVAPGQPGGPGGTTSTTSSWRDVGPPSSFPEPAMPTIGARNPAFDAFYQQLLNRSNQSLTVNPEDPAIRAQTEAFRNEQTRGSRENLAAIAERAGPNTNIGAETRHAGELVGQNTAGFQAQLMGREVESRRQEIAQALAGMAGQLGVEEQSRLRQEDQDLQKRQLQLGSQLSAAQLQLSNELGRQNASQAEWLRAFQDRGWTADQAQRAWDDQYKTMFG